MDNGYKIPANDPADIVKRSVSISGHRTSVSLERIFWELFRSNARQKGQSINELVTEIDAMRHGNLSSAIRLYVLNSLIEKTPSESDPRQ